MTNTTRVSLLIKDKVWENKDYRSFNEWIYWDTYYVKNQSFVLVIKILVKTIILILVQVFLLSRVLGIYNMFFWYTYDITFT